MKIDIRYYAGFFDGEGFCGYWGYVNKKRNYKCKNVAAGIGNTNLKILKEFQKRFGGSIRQKKISKLGSKEYYEWLVRTKQAREFLKKILPYVIEKRKRVKEVLRSWETNRSDFKWLKGKVFKRRERKDN